MSENETNKKINRRIAAEGQRVLKIKALSLKERVTGGVILLATTNGGLTWTLA